MGAVWWFSRKNSTSRARRRPDRFFGNLSGLKNPWKRNFQGHFLTNNKDKNDNN
jgi:hypothetical protein